MEGLPIVMVGVVVCCEGVRLGAVGGGCGLCPVVWCVFLAFTFKANR